MWRNLGSVENSPKSPDPLIAVLEPKSLVLSLLHMLHSGFYKLGDLQQESAIYAYYVKSVFANTNGFGSPVFVKRIEIIYNLGQTKISKSLRKDHFSDLVGKICNFPHRILKWQSKLSNI